MSLNKRYWLAQTQWIVFAPSPALAETESHQMNTSVTGVLWQQFHCAHFPSCSFKKSFKIFFFSKVKPSQSLLKMWQKLRIWGETDEKRALQSSSWAKPATERIILDFLHGNIEAGNVTAGQCCTRGWNRFAIPALSCTTTHAAKCCHFHAHLSPFLWCNMSGKLSSACPHSQTLCPTFGDTNDRSTEKIPSLHSRAVPGF